MSKKLFSKGRSSALALINYEDARTGHNYKALVNKEVDEIYKNTEFKFYGRKKK